MTRKQCKCQYVQEQGVVFARWIFFSPQLGKTQQCMGNNIFCVFSFPKNAIKAERLSVCILTERKKNETGSSGKRTRCVLLSFLCPGTAVDQVNGAMVNELLVPRPIWCSALLLCSPSPLVRLEYDLSVRCLAQEGFCPGCHFLHYSTIKNDNNLNSWPWCDYCSYMFCFPQRHNKTDDCVYFKMSDWHCSINII